MRSNGFFLFEKSRIFIKIVLTRRFLRSKNCRRIKLSKHFIKIIIQLKESLGLWRIIRISKISLYEIHDIKSLCVLFCVSFMVYGYILIDWIIRVCVFRLIKIEDCFQSFVLEILFLLVKTIQNFKMFFGI